MAKTHVWVWGIKTRIEISDKGRIDDDARELARNCLETGPVKWYNYKWRKFMKMPTRKQRDTEVAALVEIRRNGKSISKIAATERQIQVLLHDFQKGRDYKQQPCWIAPRIEEEITQ